MDELRELPAISFNQELVSAYLGVVEGQSVDGLVPPEAIVTFALKVLEEEIAVRPGTLHTSQDLEIIRPVNIGSTIYYRGALLKKIKKLGVETSLFKVDAFNQNGELILSATSTLVSPE